MIIFGGKSTEHYIAVISALHLVLHLDEMKYEVSALYIDRHGQPINRHEANNCLDTLVRENTPIRSEEITAALGIMKICLSRFPADYGRDKKRRPGLPGELNSGNFDLVFPVFHGLNGEDGTVQGLLDFLNIPYTGCGILGSALCIDKTATKAICKANNIPILDYIDILQWEWDKQGDRVMARIREELPLPVFIKPACAGSSIGTTRAVSTEGVIEGLNLAFRFDDKAIVEPALTAPREITLGIMGLQDEILLSDPGEFNYTGYDYFCYSAKYDQGAGKGIVPADLEYAVKQKMDELALIIFKSFGITGYARLDFFLVGEKIFLNEINTIPSLDSTGTFMRAWQSRGISHSAFFNRIIELALKRDRLKAKKLYNADFQSELLSDK